MCEGGKILIVSTKKQASETVLKVAETNQYYINYNGWVEC